MRFKWPLSIGFVWSDRVGPNSGPWDGFARRAGYTLEKFQRCFKFGNPDSTMANRG